MQKSVVCNGFKCCNEVCHLKSAWSFILKYFLIGMKVNLFSDLSRHYAVCSDTIGTLLSASGNGGIVIIAGYYLEYFIPQISNA